MAFAGYLTQVEVRELVQKAIDSDLLSINRSLLLAGILKPFANSLQKVLDDITQLNLDLVRINETERLANGQVPIVQYLQNTAFQLRIRGRAEAEDFERAANRIGNRAAGVPTLPATSTLPEITKNEAIVGVNDIVGIEFLAAGTVAGRSVARIRVPRFEAGTQVRSTNGVPWLMNGTAWMVGPDLMLTNHHVINSRLSGEPEAGSADFSLQAKNSVVDFDFDAEGRDTTPIRVADVLASSEPLDYAVVRVGEALGRPALKIYPQRVMFAAASYVPLNIIQHPNGDPKRVALRNNLLTGADDSTIRYFTDTDYGSSGSPVLDDSWRVVGLHRGAQFVRNVNFQGQPTAYVNFGSQIQAILGELERDHREIFALITGSQ